jgi:hypothetical protein
MSTPDLTSPPILSQAWRLEAPVREPATKAERPPISFWRSIRGMCGGYQQQLW